MSSEKRKPVRVKELPPPVVSPDPSASKGDVCGDRNNLALVPVKPSQAGPGRIMVRPRLRNDSLISPQQRDALVVSSFGIGTTRHGQPDSSASSIKGGFSTAAGSGDSVSIVVAQSEKDSVRFHLCVDALAEGCVNAFIHLFHLSHRDPVCVDQLAQTLFKIPDERLVWVKAQLTSVEVLRRQSEFRDVCERCRLLADYFESERDFEEAAWHYDTALRIAMESLDRPLEQEVRLAFGAFFERHKQPRKAIALYEEVYHLAGTLNDVETAIEANYRLIRAYLNISAELKDTNSNEAIHFLERALEMSQRVKSAEDEADSLHALGNIYEHMGDFRKALQYQQQFFEVSRAANLVDREKQASLCVASMQERLNLTEEAVLSLQCALTLSEKAGDIEGIYRATLQLGQAYDSSGDHEKALTSYRANFGAARKLNNSNLTDQARVALGFALGEHYLKHAGGGRGYVPIVCDDVRAQLEWMSNGIL